MNEKRRRETMSYMLRQPCMLDSVKPKLRDFYVYAVEMEEGMRCADGNVTTFPYACRQKH